jgi:glycosyltransferase involved in cell wall biosynthesis
LRVCVLTTSYPRTPGEPAGSFVADTVLHLRAAGVEVDVVSPATFRHFGIAYGDGIVQNLRAAPWRVLLVPLFLGSFALAARRAASRADVVHAHWLPSALPALATRKPFVLQVWGTDVELAARAPWLARPLARRSRSVVAASSSLAEAARRLGARDVRVIPNGVDIPALVGDPDEPPHVLFAGRLSEEKGILEFLQATDGTPRVVVGDGPLRDRVPNMRGSVPHELMGGYYERAAVVCVPSRREGYGMVAREAMAHGRPVVATGVGGLVDAVSDGETGIVVPAGDTAALRSAITGLLEDPEARGRLGAAGRARAERELSPEATTAALVDLYEETAG